MDDNPINQRVGTAMLENLGFRADVVADGAQAVLAATATPYHAILMDCQIPVLDGYEATREIRRLQGGTQRTPIIAVTAWASRSDHQRCLTAGMDDYLTKPLSLESLSDALARWTHDGQKLAVPVEPEVTAEPVELTSAPAPDPRQLVLDQEVVGRLIGLGKAAGLDLLGQLAALFAADADERVITLREALADGDPAAVIRTAHALSGASANVGARGLARLCATLERDGVAGNLERGATLLTAIEAELGRVRSALDAWTVAA